MVKQRVEQFVIEHTKRNGRFLTFDWAVLIDRINGEIAEDSRDEAWRLLEKYWREQLLADCGEAYSERQNTCFSLIAASDEAWCKKILAFMDGARARIFNSLPGIAASPTGDQLYAIVLEDLDTYYEYVANFYPEEGEFSLSGGMYIFNGYPHLVLQQDVPTSIQSVIAHELTHAYISHLPLPLWLNEGIAVSMEDAITGGVPFVLDDEMIERHRAFWTENAIQDFWTGDAFHQPGEANPLSYHLARFLVKCLAHDFDAFARFVCASHWQDAGQAAAMETFESGLGDLAARMLGEGSWAPRALDVPEPA